MKTCSKCNISKEISEFPNDSKGREGKSGTCKVCKNRISKALRDNYRLTAKPEYIITKTCNKCALTKSGTEFYKESGSKDGLGTICKTCKTENVYKWREANKEQYNKTQRDYQATVPAEVRYGIEIKRRYGCTLEQYNTMLLAQEGKCALCNELHNPASKRGRLYVDHDHVTSKVRGLLCRSCNCMLGYAKDDTRLLLEAVAYIIKHRK